MSRQLYWRKTTFLPENGREKIGICIQGRNGGRAGGRKEQRNKGVGEKKEKKEGLHSSPVTIPKS